MGRTTKCLHFVPRAPAKPVGVPVKAPLQITSLSIFASLSSPGSNPGCLPLLWDEGIHSSERSFLTQLKYDPACGVFFNLLLQTRAKYLCSIFSTELETSSAKRAEGIEVFEDPNQPQDPAWNPVLEPAIKLNTKPSHETQPQNPAWKPATILTEGRHFCSYYVFFFFLSKITHMPLSLSM